MGTRIGTGQHSTRRDLDKCGRLGYSPFDGEREMDLPAGVFSIA
jgi:hypothetical protein